MVTPDSLFVGSIPELYDRLMVPMLFSPYAVDLANRLAVLHPEVVLETAAGTGAVTREVLARLTATAHIVASDVNPDMLTRAQSNVSDPKITWAHADAMALPFDAASFDAVLCQFGVMFFPDRVQAYREALRVLKPGGTFLFNVWDSVAHNDFVRVASAELARIFPTDPPVFMERTPHGYFDLARIDADLRLAKFAEITIDPVTMISRAGSAIDAAMAYCQGTPLRGEILARGPDRLAEVTQKIAQALSREFGTGAIAGNVQAYVITAKG